MIPILNLISREKYDFENKDITIVDGYTFNQPDTIDRIYRYYNSKFEEGDVDREGNKKYFFNIVKNPCKVTTKAIDFDTKDIRVLTAEGGESLKTWLMERDLKFWMKDKQFGKILNRIFYELPIFGSAVLKAVNNKPYFVDLRNFIVEQCADSLDQANYITEIHYYTPREFQKIGKEMKWKDVKKAVDEHRKMKDKPFITVYERYGEVEVKEGEWKYRKVVIADVGVDETDRYGKLVAHAGVEMENTPINKHPYWEFHLEKMPGRWLGTGVVESLFEPQVRLNEIANLQAKGSYWNAARVFQSRDESVNRNLKRDVTDGEVLFVESEITQVNMGDRNLAFFNDETIKWLKNKDELALTYDVNRGERLPAGSTATGTRIAAFMSGAYFEVLRENIGLDIKEFLFTIIIPDFQKAHTKKHTLRIAGEDMDKIRTLIINQKSTDELFKFVDKNGKLPTQLHYDTMKFAINEMEKQDKEKLLTISDGFYKDLKYKIDIDITGESKDNATYAAALFAALQAVTLDPTILEDPVKKKFLYKWMEAQGISPIDFEPEVKTPGIEELNQGIGPQVETPMMPRGGGGVSRPTQMTGETPVTKTL